MLDIFKSSFKKKENTNGNKGSNYEEIETLRSSLINENKSDFLLNERFKRSFICGGNSPSRVSSACNAINVSMLTRLDLSSYLSSIDLVIFTSILQNLPTLQSLKVGNDTKTKSPITDAFCDVIVEKLPLLRHLDIHSSFISDVSLRKIATLHISILNISDCPLITDAGISSLDKNFSLIDLDISSNRNLKTICRPPNLRYLNIYNNVSLTDSVISSLPDSLYFIEIWGLSDNITNAAFDAFLARSRSLRKLYIQCNPRITDASLKVLVKNCPYLKELNIWGCENVTDAGIIPLVKACSSLVSLNVGGCSNFTDNAINAIANNCNELLELSISRLPKINDSTIELISKKCNQLIYLNIAYCVRLSDASLDAFFNRCPSLRVINVWGCSKMTERAMDTLNRKRPVLDILC